MSKPEQYSASRLAEALQQYGDLPVSVVFVDTDGAETTVLKLRLELNIRDHGRWVAVTAYEDDEDTAAELEEIGEARMNWFVDGLTREAMRTELTDGIKAYVYLYYQEYTDATQLEPEVVRSLNHLLDFLPGMGLSDGVEEIVSEFERELNDRGGIRSDSDGTYHPVCTFPEEG